MSKKILIYPETRQIFDYDCGANGIMSMLVYAGVEEREERIVKLAGTTKKEGTNVKGVDFRLRLLRPADQVRRRHDPGRSAEGH